MTVSERRLRVLHVTPFYCPAWAYGGIPRAVYALARAQQATGTVDVEVVTTDVFDAKRRFRGPGQDPAVRYFRNWSNRLAYRHMLPLPIGLRRYLRQHARSFDIAHLHGCRHFLNEIYVRTRDHPPFVLSPHGTLPRIETKLLVKRLYDMAIGTRPVTHASRIIALTHAEASQFGQVPAHRIAILPDIVEDPAAEAGVDGTGSPEQTLGRYILYLGKLTPRKRVDLLLRAFARVDRRDLRLVIAGNDMGEGAALRRLAAALELGDRVVFTGLVTGQSRHSALTGATLLVYPGEHEVFGLVAFEALHAGVVPVVSDDSGCGELIRDGGCGYVFRRGSVEDLEAVIVAALADHSGRAERLGRARSFLTRFSPENIARRSMEIYQDVLREKQSARPSAEQPPGLHNWPEDESAAVTTPDPPVAR